jgi:rhomboid protease GluP
LTESDYARVMAVVDDEAASELLEAGTYATHADGAEHGLVVLAMGRPYWLVPSPVGQRLLVEAEAFEQAREQLDRFDRESIGWPPQPPAESQAPATDFVTPLLWALVVLAVFRLESARPDWVQLGLLDPAAVFDLHQWWRIGTALFLHADTGHVVSNVVSGIFIFSAVLKTLGRRTGWLLLALAGLAGNLAVAALNYGEPYRSLGASTAIFAGVGLLTGRALRVLAKNDQPNRWRAMFVALGSGVVVLALYGTGALHVDLGAHLMGFAIGLALGFAAGARWLSGSMRETERDRPGFGH